MTSRMGHINLAQNQTCGTHFCLQHPSRCECTQLPRNPHQSKNVQKGGVRKKEKRREVLLLGEKAVMFCSYISWLLINVFSDWKMNEVFFCEGARTHLINFIFIFILYCSNTLFLNFVPHSHLCCVTGP